MRTLGPLQRRFDAIRGLWRSIRVYRLDRAHHQAMDALYRRFVRPGDLVFDVGAHVGDRVASFRRLGARVVALEPQAGPAAVIRFCTAMDPAVTVLRMACGAQEGSLRLRVNTRNPTVSTASDAFVASTAGAPGWDGQVWDAETVVPVTTLDRLMAAHGAPAFIKIDVEGFEEAVLMGLSRAVPALSFEFTTVQRDVALRALARLEALGAYRFNYALGESQRLALPDWTSGPALSAILEALPPEANSGDVYAALEPPAGDVTT